MANQLSDSEIKSICVTPARGALVQRNTVILSFLRLGGANGRKRMLRLPRKYVEFLYFFGRDGLSFEAAAEKAKLSIERANYFWSRKDVQDWLKDRSEEAAAQVDWCRPEKWFYEGDQIYRGEKTVTKEQLEVWRELGNRVAPKRQSDGATSSKIEIHISPDAVDKALNRQKHIEAEVLKETVA